MLGQSICHLETAIARQDNISIVFENVLHHFGNTKEIDSDNSQECFTKFHELIKELNKKDGIPDVHLSSIAKVYIHFDSSYKGVKYLHKYLRGLQSFVQTDTDTCKTYLKLMKRFGYTSQAVEEIQRLIKDVQEQDECKYLQGLCLMEQKRFHEAKKILLSCGETIPDAKSKLVYVFRRTGNTQEAFTLVYTLGQTLEPSEGKFALKNLYQHGQMKFGVKDYKGAAKSFKAYIKTLACLFNRTEDIYDLYHEIMRLVNVKNMICFSNTYAHLENKAKTRPTPEKIAKFSRDRDRTLTSWGKLNAAAHEYWEKGLYTKALLNILMYLGIDAHNEIPGIFISSTSELICFTIILLFTCKKIDEAMLLTCEYLELALQGQKEFSGVFLFKMLEVHTLLINFKFMAEAKHLLNLIRSRQQERHVKGPFILAEAAFYHQSRNYEIAVKKFEEGYTLYPPAKSLHLSVIGSYIGSCAHLKQWKKIIKETDRAELLRVLDNVDEETRCKYYLMRGWSFTNLKMYSEAIANFNSVIECSMNLQAIFAALLLKMVTLEKKGQYKNYWKFLAKLVRENDSMKKFLKSLQSTIGVYCPYLISEWPKIMKLIAPAVHQIMPYPKSELLGFQMYRSSSAIQLHLLKKISKL